VQLAEFRWILLGLGLLLIAGIWWWGGRRSAQAPGNAELRETTAKEPPRQESSMKNVEPFIETHEWEISPFEPLSIKSADFHQIPILDGPMMVDVETQPREPEFLDDAETIPNADIGPVMPPVLTKVAPAADVPIEQRIVSSAPTAAAASPSGAPPSGAPPSGAPPSDNSDRISTQAPRSPNTSEKQKIVSVRVCAPAEAPWAGSALLSAFELHGLAHGRYQVFHRRHVDGRSLFCVASLVEPGTFDVARMAEQEFKGITLFAVLPGPVDPLLTIDEMLSAARGLAGELPGVLQDARGAALSPQKLAALRDDVAHFLATLPVA
jgi:cell division protein ZipA